MTHDSVARQRAHYEANAASYVEGRLESAAYRAHLETWAGRLLEPWLARCDEAQRRGQAVLDPMCGHGNLAPFLLEHAGTVLLNDLSPEMLDYLDDDVRRRCTVLPPADVCSLPVDTAGVDVVVISGGLHHVHRQLDAALAEIRRVLRPGGLLLFGEPSDEFVLIRAARRTTYRLSRSFDAETERAFRPAALRDRLEAASFADVDIRPFGSVGYLLMGQTGVVPVLRRSRSRRLFRALRSLDALIERTPLLRATCLAMTGSAVAR